MPAWFLILKIKKIMVPIPWFIFWLLIAPFVPIAWIIGSLGRLVGARSYVFRILEESWRLFLVVTCLHGLEVNVRNTEDVVRVSFI